MDRQIKNDLKRVAEQLPSFPITHEKETSMFGGDYLAHMTKVYGQIGEEVPEDKLIVNKKDVRLPRYKNELMRVKIPVTETIGFDLHVRALKRHYAKDGQAGVDKYCKEVTKHVLEMRRKEREAKRGQQSKDVA